MTGTTSAPPFTESEPEGSAKSFWTSTTMSAVVGVVAGHGAMVARPARLEPMRREPARLRAATRWRAAMWTSIDRHRATCPAHHPIDQRRPDMGDVPVPGGRLGQLVPVDQDRARRGRGAADHREHAHALRRHAAGGGAAGAPRTAAAAVERLEAHVLPGRYQHRGALRAHRLGTAVHPLGHGRDPQRDGAAVHHRARRLRPRRRAHHRRQAGRAGHRLPGRHRAGLPSLEAAGADGDAALAVAGMLAVAVAAVFYAVASVYTRRRLTGHAHHRAVRRLDAGAAAGGDRAGQYRDRLHHDHRAGTHLRAACGRRPGHPRERAGLGGA